MDLLVFEDESFDVVFDKSTLDALKCRGAEATSSSSVWQLVAAFLGGEEVGQIEVVFHHIILDLVMAVLSQDMNSASPLVQACF